MKINRVVVTGIGIIAPLGATIEEFWGGLLEGKNGIVPVPNNGCEFSVPYAGLVPDFTVESFAIYRKNRFKKLSFTVSLLMYAGLSALDNAGVHYPEDVCSYNTGIIVGTGTALADRYTGVPYQERNPLWFLETYPNVLQSYLCSAASIKGYCSTVVSACVSSALAIGQAYHRIKYGHDKMMLAGGVDNKFSPPFFAGFNRLGLLSQERDPDKAMRPFDKKRSGFAIAKGACMLLLESLENARERGAPVLGEIVGYGSSMNPGSIVDASAEAIIRSMQIALEEAAIAPGDIGYINAHGSSTQSNDTEESLAIKGLFGKYAYAVPVNSTKSMIGHTFAACGAIEAAVCLMSMRHKQIHKTRNFEEGGRDCDLDYVPEGARCHDIQYCISNNSGIGGFNSCLVFKNFTG